MSMYILKNRALYALGALFIAAMVSLTGTEYGEAQQPAASKKPSASSAKKTGPDGAIPEKAGKTPPSAATGKVADTKTPISQKTSSGPAKKDRDGEKQKKEEERKKKDELREKKHVEWIERTIEYGIQQDRLEAINSILKIRDASDRERLGGILRNTLKEEIDIEVKAKTITVLGEMKFKEALPELTAAIDDDSLDVKIAAVFALKRIQDRSVTGKLSEELKKQDFKKQSNYTEALIDALGTLKTIELKDFAIGEIKKDTTNTTNRQYLVIFLGRIEAKDAKDYLLGLAKDDSEDNLVRAYAVNSLARMQLSETAPEIGAILKEIDSYPFKKRQRYYKLYIYSIAALARLGDKSVYPRLVNAVRSNNEQVRLQAVRLIKDINEKRTIDILKHKMKYDPSPRVQRAAKEALEELGIPPDEEKKDAAKSVKKSETNEDAKKDAPERKEGK